MSDAFWQVVNNELDAGGFGNLTFDAANQVIHYMKTECVPTIPFISRTFTDAELLFALGLVEYDRENCHRDNDVQEGYIYKAHTPSFAQMFSGFIDLDKVLDKLEKHLDREVARRDLRGTAAVVSTIARYLERSNSHEEEPDVRDGS